mmetsp:Transcript_7063/g.12503  ORF Transcript_7063/g.12503 Transcript_7063/m.12503 type:complete len:997 (+) Transcript_7063:182-3172(+)|eukprot:CAMPEP_0171504318 /NCGR_PEP_ID=MMETSP0958-20121227/11492_1 /TAXON_ID=87120 /ORGANISM="Aurantiochytrium limacinum, Strain ATCCMYA-1381" /LENGTH=996 /DNA_ID=CAMNT_0012040121 /DNA_START=1384 /DNA_END=4374 /DNA_ORIENTATION=-
MDPPSQPMSSTSSTSASSSSAPPSIPASSAPRIGPAVPQSHPQSQQLHKAPSNVPSEAQISSRPFSSSPVSAAGATAVSGKQQITSPLPQPASSSKPGQHNITSTLGVAAGTTQNPSAITISEASTSSRRTGKSASGGSTSPKDPGSDSQIQYRHVQSACMACRKSRVKCDRMLPCARCRRLNIPCEPQLRTRGRPPSYRHDPPSAKASPAAASTSSATPKPSTQGSMMSSSSPLSPNSPPAALGSPPTTASPTLKSMEQPTKRKSKKKQPQLGAAASPSLRAPFVPTPVITSGMRMPSAPSISQSKRQPRPSPQSQQQPNQPTKPLVSKFSQETMQPGSPSTSSATSGPQSPPGSIASGSHPGQVPSPLANLPRSFLMGRPELEWFQSLQNIQQKFMLSNPSPPGQQQPQQQPPQASPMANSPLGGLTISTSPTSQTGISLPMVSGNTSVGSPQYPAGLGSSSSSSSSSVNVHPLQGRQSPVSEPPQHAKNPAPEEKDMDAQPKGLVTTSATSSSSQAVPFRIPSSASLGSMGSAQSPIGSAGGGSSPHHSSMTIPWVPSVGGTSHGDSPTLAAEHHQLHCSPVEAMAETFVDLFHRNEINTNAAIRFVKLCLYLFRAKPTDQLRDFVERAAGVLQANPVDIYNKQSESLNQPSKGNQSKLPDASARAEALSQRFGFREKWAVEGAAFAELSVAEGVLTARCNPLWNRLFPNNDVLARLGLLDAIALPFPERDGATLFHEIAEIVLTKTDDITVARKILSMYLGGTPHKLSALVDMHFCMSEDGSIAQCTLRALPLPESPAFSMQQGCIFKSQYFLQMLPVPPSKQPTPANPLPSPPKTSEERDSTGKRGSDRGASGSSRSSKAPRSQQHQPYHHQQQQYAPASGASSLSIMDLLRMSPPGPELNTGSDMGPSQQQLHPDTTGTKRARASSGALPSGGELVGAGDLGQYPTWASENPVKQQQQPESQPKRQKRTTSESTGTQSDRPLHKGKLSSV